MFFHLQSFRSYLTAALAVTVTVPLVVLAVAEHLSVVKTDEAYEKERRDAAVLIADGLSRQVRTAQGLVRLLADRVSEEASDKALQRHAEKMLGEFPEFLNIHVDAPDGTCRLFVSTEKHAEPQIGTSHGERWHMLRQAEAPGDYISGAFQGEGATERWIVSLTTAATAAKGSVAGYACGALNLTEIARRSLEKVPESFAVTIADSEGFVIWSSEEGIETGSRLAGTDMPAKKGMTAATDALTGWQVRVSSPRLLNIRNDNIVLALGVMLLTLLATLFAGAGVAGPLTRSVDRLSEEISGRVRPDGRVSLPLELKRLREAWLRAVKDRDLALTRLEHVNDGLEATVKERTAHIEKQKALLDALIRSLSDGVILSDAKGRAAIVNPKAGEMTGIRRGEKVAAQLQGLMPAFESRMEEVGENRYQTKDGRTFEVVPFEVRYPVRGGNGNGLVLRDVTEKARLDALRSALVSVVAHEMKTPLSALRLQTDELSKPVGEWTDAVRESVSRDIDESVAALERLINDWLDWSRIENGTLFVLPRLIRLDTAAAKAAKAVSGLYPDLTISVRKGSVPPVAFADPDRLRQVFVNLFSNAARYRSADAPAVEVSFATLGDQAIITVSDNGIGIPADKRERVFDCFYQIDMGTTRRAGGTGLGLAICRGIMSALKGEIRIAEKDCPGTVFEISLPLNGNEEEDDEE